MAFDTIKKIILHVCSKRDGMYFLSEYVLDNFVGDKHVLILLALWVLKAVTVREKESEELAPPHPFFILQNGAI